jgi:hypothetical protein
VRGVYRLYPAEGVEGDVAAEEHAIEGSEALGVVRKRRSGPNRLGDCFVGVKTPPRNCGR